MKTFYAQIGHILSKSFKKEIFSNWLSQGSNEFLPCTRIRVIPPHICPPSQQAPSAMIRKRARKLPDPHTHSLPFRLWNDISFFLLSFPVGGKRPISDLRFISHKKIPRRNLWLPGVFLLRGSQRKNKRNRNHSDSFSVFPGFLEGKKQV